MPTEVEFHTGVDEPLVFACRLLRKAYRKGVRVVVTAPPAVLARLDRELWTFDDLDFVPHVRWAANTAAPRTAGRTPIWLVDGEPPADAPSVLVNVGASRVDEQERFERIIEIVSDDTDDLQAGRLRWRDYLQRGLSPMNHPSNHG